MLLYKRLLCLPFACFFLAASGQQQAQPFADEIAAFARQDSLQKPGKGMILFTGSSSIRLWKTLEEDFPAHKVLNRGFGGASLPDAARYTAQTIYRYKPSQIVFYCGENDLAGSDTIQAGTVVARFQALFSAIRKELPGVPFVFISIKPSPSRAHLMSKVVAANAGIKAFLSREKNTRFVDVFTPMLTQDGRPRGELFTADSLHMNGAGYAIWKQEVAPALNTRKKKGR